LSYDLYVGGAVLEFLQVCFRVALRFGVATFFSACFGVGYAFSFTTIHEEA
jgi:hypothetical protein